LLDSTGKAFKYSHMNILIITGIFPPDIGGPASHVPSIAKALAERGHQLSVITLSDSLKHKDTAYPFLVIRILRSLPRPWRFLKTVVKIIQQGRKADVLFVHGLALESVMANFSLRKPLVQKVVGDLAWERASTFGLTGDRIDEFQRKKYTIYVELLKKLRSFWIKKSHLVITPSIYLKGIIQGWGVSEEKTSVIYNAVQYEETDNGERPDLFQQIGRNRKKIVSIGRLVPWKGFEDLIKAVHNIHETQLIVIGEGPERSKLEALIYEKKLQNRVHLIGILSRKEVFSFLKHADLFVLNSTYEGLPHIVLEAMAAGTPVVATDTGGTGELVQDGYNGILVPPSDPEFLESSIKEILRDENLKKNLVQNGYATLKKFDWKNLVEQTEDAIINIVKDKAQVSPESSRAHFNGSMPVLFLSTTRYSSPPDPTLEKKWKGLQPFFQSTVISFSDGFWPFTSVLEGARWILLPSGLPRFVRYLFHFFVSLIFSFYGAVGKKYRAIIAQSPYEAVAPALALLPWRIARSASRPKLIVEVHSDWKQGVMFYHRSLFSRIEKPLRFLTGRFSMSQADAYRAISEYCRGLLPDRQKPVFIFPTFTDLESFKEPPDELIREIGKKHGKGFFLYAGMLIFLKGIHHLIKAFSDVLTKYPDVRLIIAGKGEEEEKLKSLAEKSGVGGCVHFVGHLDQQTLGAYIKNARALVLPSLTEGLGRVAIEAHLLERPVIASRVGGIPEIVSDEKTGLLVEPGDAESLGNALVKLLDNPELADSMGKAGKEAVINKFNYQTYYRSYYDMVRETCKK
jgi:glycosyltransferase involved in cell wall biosynthesis